MKKYVPIYFMPLFFACSLFSAAHEVTKEDTSLNFYSASEAHLRNWYNDFKTPFENLINTHLEKNSFKLNIPVDAQEQIHAILNTENERKNEIVLYHALPFSVAFCTDIIKILRDIIIQKTSIAYRWEDAFEKLNNYQEYFDKEYNQKGGWTNEKERVLCTNLALFGNESIDPESTFKYWAKNSSASSNGKHLLEKILKPIFKSIGLPEGLYTDYITLYEKAISNYPASGRLLQIFINPEEANHLAFVYWILAGGTSHLRSDLPIEFNQKENDLLPINEEEWKECNKTCDTFGDFLKQQALHDKRNFTLSHDMNTIMNLYKTDPNKLDSLLTKYKVEQHEYALKILKTNDYEKLFNNINFRAKQYKRPNGNELNKLQGRFLALPQLINNPQIISINQYWFTPWTKEQEEKYQMELREQVMDHLNLLFSKQKNSKKEKYENIFVKKMNQTKDIFNLDSPARDLIDSENLLVIIQNDDLKSLKKIFDKKENAPFLFEPFYQEKIIAGDKHIIKFTLFDQALSLRAENILSFLKEKIVTPNALLSDELRGELLFNLLFIKLDDQEEINKYKETISSLLEENATTKENFSKQYEQFLSLTLNNKKYKGFQLSPIQITQIWRLIANMRIAPVNPIIFMIGDEDFLNNERFKQNISVQINHFFTYSLLRQFKEYLTREEDQKKLLPVLKKALYQINAILLKYNENSEGIRKEIVSNLSFNVRALLLTQDEKESLINIFNENNEN
jgi:hypothetical protein